ncbi:recombinase family protein [Alicyclobacillus fastidiosus]|uniref:Recombinase family protein n=1 Tax=Alicyclobacillus fastidiosus TaxID=392011 RepID=A0ABY6ZDQ3_9BACL|nr:recombinase family protein [Alicyclobacillus fastidiosus]WAH40855.1 recombinase family protein [Alicyclobacillus fastidiosus]
MLKRTAIYIRVSTGAQAADGHSLDVQLEQCLQQANTLGLAQRDIEVYREAGASGEDMDRPELTRLLDDATQGKLTHVIVKHPDRLSRNVADKAIIVRQLKQHDVQIVFVDVPDWDQSDEANLLFNIISSIAEYELRQIRRRTLSGKLRAAREGQMMPMGIDPYGYKYESGQFLVDEEEAAFVRLIFDWYVEERLSMRDIAKRLDELGAPTKTRKSLCWSHATIAHILQNEMYIGRYTYNRRKTAKAPLATARGRKRVRRVTGWHPGAEWISYTVPRIVDDETFRRAALRRQAAKRQGCQRNSHEHLLQGKLRCRVCHRVWYAAASKKQGANTTRMYRRPPEHKGEPRQCAHGCRAIRAEDIERAVFREVVHRLFHSREWAQLAADSASVQSRRLHDELRLFEEQSERIVQRQERLRNLYLTGDLSKDDYTQQLGVARRQGEQIAGQLERLQEVKRRSEADWQSDMQALHDCLMDVQGGAIPFAVRRQIICDLVDECLLDATGDSVAVAIRGIVTTSTSS